MQSAFIHALLGENPTLIDTLEWTLLNSTVALVSYFCSWSPSQSCSAAGW